MCPQEMISTEHNPYKANLMPGGMLSLKITICFFLFENLLSKAEHFLPYEY